MIIKGFTDEQDVNNNIYFVGQLVIADKFIDYGLDISGSVLYFADNQLNIVTRYITEYGYRQNKYEINLGSKNNTLNFIEHNMGLFVDFTFEEIVDEVNLLYV